MKPILVALAAGVVLSLASTPAQAGIAVSPLKQEVTVKPGRTETFYITVANPARKGKGERLPVRLDVMDFSTSREGDLTFHEPGTAKYSVSKWIKVARTSFVLEPGESQKVACEVSVPWTASGEYYGAIMVTPSAPREIPEKGLTVQCRIASGVFVTVPGRLYPKRARLAECRVAVPAAPDKPELAVTAAIANEGRVLFVANGEVRIRDKDRGRLWAKFPLKTRREMVLPGDLRDFCGSPSHPLPAGEYVAEVVLEYGSEWKKAHTTVPFSVSPAQAEAWQEKTKPDHGAAIVVEPARIEQVVPPGGFRRLTLKLSNTKPFPVGVTAQVVEPTEQGGELGQWIVLNPASLSLTGNENRTIVFNLSVPKDAGGMHKGTLQLAVKDANGRNLAEEPIEVPLTVSIR